MNLRTVFMWSIVAVVFVCMAVFVAGCKDDDNPAAAVITPITEDLFPLTVGNSISFSGYLRSKTTDQNIDSSGTVYASKWTVLSNAAPAPDGSTANLVTDTLTLPGWYAGVPVPAFKAPTNYLFKRATPTGTANFSFLNNIGPFFRKFGIARSDSLVWILIGDMSAGAGATGKEWSAFDSTYTGFIAPTVSGTIRLEIVGRFTREDITFPNAVGGSATFTSTYKLTATRHIYLNGSLASTAETASVWLVPNVGPVKVIFNTDGETYGHTKEYKSKSF
ncbi:MAG TPA: hypothetical protein DCX46_08845 [Bacteroidetes bacterium]|nr:hypothetical protein [Bacteroidota bacterium]